MVPRCSVCSHPSRPEIDRGLMKGVPYRSLAGQFGLSPSALCRHTKHLARQLDFQQRREVASRQDALLEKLDLLDTRLDRLFNSALDLRSLHVALGCIRESLRLHSQITLLERLRLGRGGSAMMVPFRYGCGAITKYAANKEACRPNLPGLKRHKDGTIGGKNCFNETARMGNCLILTKKLLDFN